MPSSFIALSSLFRYQQGSTLLTAQQVGAESADDEQRPLLAEIAERVLHLARDLLVELVGVRVRAEAVAQVDRRQHLDRDLRRQRQAAREVEEVDPERRPDRDRHHLDAGQAVEAEQLRRALPAGDE